MDPIVEIGFYYNCMYNYEIERVGIQLDSNSHFIDGNGNMIYVYMVYIYSLICISFLAELIWEKEE